MASVIAGGQRINERESKNNGNAQHRNVKFIVAAAMQLPWPPAGWMEAGDLITHLREGKLR